MTRELDPVDEDDFADCTVAQRRVLASLLRAVRLSTCCQPGDECPIAVIKISLSMIVAMIQHIEQHAPGGVAAINRPSARTKH